MNKVVEDYIRDQNRSPQEKALQSIDAIRSMAWLARNGLHPTGSPMDYFEYIEDSAIKVMDYLKTLPERTI